MEQLPCFEDNLSLKTISAYRDKASCVLCEIASVEQSLQEKKQNVLEYIRGLAQARMNESIAAKNKVTSQYDMGLMSLSVALSSASSEYEAMACELEGLWSLLVLHNKPITKTCSAVSHHKLTRCAEHELCRDCAWDNGPQCPHCKLAELREQLDGLKGSVKTYFENRAKYTESFSEHDNDFPCKSARMYRALGDAIEISWECLSECCKDIQQRNAKESLRIEASKPKQDVIFNNPEDAGILAVLRLRTLWNSIMFLTLFK